MGAKNNRGNNQRTYALYEELRHLRVSPQAEVPYIYKRLDRQQDLPVEERAYQVRVPVPMEKGVRKSLRTSDRTIAIERAEDLVLELKSVLRAGGTASKVTTEDLIWHKIRKLFISMVVTPYYWILIVLIPMRALIFQAKKLSRIATLVSTLALVVGCSGGEPEARFPVSKDGYTPVILKDILSGKLDKNMGVEVDCQKGVFRVTEFLPNSFMREKLGNIEVEIGKDYQPSDAKEEGKPYSVEFYEVMVKNTCDGKAFDMWEVGG